jgi:glycine cleavage system aminomethyltransferase T
MKQSRLHDDHAKLKAIFEAVTEWQMPAHYGDMLHEYRAVREAVGVADLSHRGKVRVTGEDRVKWLQSVISNDITRAGAVF